MPTFKLDKVKPKRREWTELEKMIYRDIVSNPHIHQYTYHNGWKYVVRHTDYIYIHYSMEMADNEITLHYNLSYQITHVDIP